MAELLAEEAKQGDAKPRRKAKKKQRGTGPPAGGEDANAEGPGEPDEQGP